MKRDHHGVLVREKPRPPGHEIANLGDSCAETCRFFILVGDDYWSSIKPFFTERGFIRHPDLKGIEGWDERDFVNDQLLPLILATWASGQMFTSPSRWYRLTKSPFIYGTRTIVSPGAWAAARGYWRLLNAFNVIQGWLFNIRWRWSDDERMKGKLWKFERSEGKVQDWLNYICVYVFLRRIGKRPTLNQPIERTMAAVRKYYLEGDDAEPNSEWIVNAYEFALKEGEF